MSLLFIPQQNVFLKKDFIGKYASILQAKAAILLNLLRHKALLKPPQSRLVARFAS
jgi:hypothetical protein